MLQERLSRTSKGETKGGNFVGIKKKGLTEIWDDYKEEEEDEE